MLLDSVEVGWDFKPSTETAPLEPGHGVLVCIG